MAADAFFRGCRIIVARDVIQAFTDEEHQGGLEYIKKVYNAEMKSVDEIIKDLDSSFTS